MKTTFLLLISIIVFLIPPFGRSDGSGWGAFAQSFTINPNGTSAIVEANSTTIGFLPPRMTMVQRSNLIAIDGLMIYCTDCAPAGHYAYSGSTWKPMFDYLTASGPCVQYTVGQQAQGGTVIWVDDSGQHGLVAAPVDMSRLDVSPVGTFTRDFFPWSVGQNYANTAFTKAQRHGIYGGQTNTEKIIEHFGWAEYAAFLCTQRNWSGYGDWYLPSIDELIILYNNRNLLPTPLTTSSPNVPPGYVTAEDMYWSSTESSVTTAYAIKVSDNGNYGGTQYPIGSVVNPNKWDAFTIDSPLWHYKLHIRAVRRF